MKLYSKYLLLSDYAPFGLERIAADIEDCLLTVLYFFFKLIVTSVAGYNFIFIVLPSLLQFNSFLHASTYTN